MTDANDLTDIETTYVPKIKTIKIPTTIRIKGRDFAVTAEQGADGRLVYHLRGKRGAHYFTMRTEPGPLLMFICDARHLGIASTMDGVWLTDEGGELRVLRE
jgi:hypothetical protein